MYEVWGQAGGGLVKVTMTCRHDARKIEIGPSVLSGGGDSDKREVLEDLIAAAINDAVRKVEAVAGEKMGGLDSGLGGAGLNLANFKQPVFWPIRAKVRRSKPGCDACPAWDTNRRREWRVTC